jgi:hypothetical protein
MRRSIAAIAVRACSLSHAALFRASETRANFLFRRGVLGEPLLRLTKARLLRGQRVDAASLYGERLHLVPRGAKRASGVTEFAERGFQPPDVDVDRVERGQDRRDLPSAEGSSTLASRASARS